MIGYKNEKKMARMAVIFNILGLYTFVIAKTPVFSEYVVFATDPISPANIVAIPSPRIVLCRPGSLTKSFSQTFELAEISPICSNNVANTTGAISTIAFIENLGN